MSPSSTSRCHRRGPTRGSLPLARSAGRSRTSVSFALSQYLESDDATRLSTGHATQDRSTTSPTGNERCSPPLQKDDRTGRFHRSSPSARRPSRRTFARYFSSSACEVPGRPSASARRVGLPTVSALTPPRSTRTPRQRFGTYERRVSRPAAHRTPDRGRSSEALNACAARCREHRGTTSKQTERCVRTTSAGSARRARTNGIVGGWERVRRM